MKCCPFRIGQWQFEKEGWHEPVSPTKSLARQQVGGGDGGQPRGEMSIMALSLGTGATSCTQGRWATRGDCSSCRCHQRWMAQQQKQRRAGSGPQAQARPFQVAISGHNSAAGSEGRQPKPGGRHRQATGCSAQTTSSLLKIQENLTRVLGPLALRADARSASLRMRGGSFIRYSCAARQGQGRAGQYNAYEGQATKAKPREGGKAAQTCLQL